MAITIELPSVIRPQAFDSTAVVIDAACASVREALAALGAHCPGVLDRVMTEEGDLRPHVNVFVGEENSRFIGGLDAPVPDGSTLMILAAISGG